MDKLKMHSPNFTDENIKKLAELFPSCVTESKNKKGELQQSIDFDLLKQELSDSIVEGQRERYQLNWPGKREALLTANTPITKTLRPNREESVDFDTTENLFIEGDNLDALKLLQETYLGKVKMIYIDPPYNTGKDFVYEDNFTTDKEEYDHLSEQKDDLGGRLVANLDSNGRFHSDWLDMIYSRLKLARNLLREDGVIFISIDDNEVSNLIKVCNEIFGEDNYIGTVCWKNKYGAGAKTKGFIEVHEYILCFSKANIENIESILSEEQIKEYEKNKDDNYEIRGGYVTQPLMTNSMDDRENLQYNIEYKGDVISPRKQWVWSENRLLEAIDNDEVVFKKKTNGEYSVRAKVYLKNHLGVIRKGKPLSLLNGPFNQEGTKEVEQLLGPKVFSFPKPSRLIQHLFGFTINEIEDNNGVYLDFFSGSSSSIQAIFGLNLEDKGSRKIILVQLPEVIDDTAKKKKENKAAIKFLEKSNLPINISEISKERIRRAGKKIKKDNSDKEGIESLDTGFRVLKIDSSNMKNVYYSPDAISQTDLVDQTDNIKPHRTAEDLLFQVLLDWGVDLSLPIYQETIEGKTVYFVDGNALAACFETNVTEALVKELAQREPLRAVFRDSGYSSDSTKINIEQIFKLVSPATEVKAI